MKPKSCTARWSSTIVSRTEVILFITSWLTITLSHNLTRWGSTELTISLSRLQFHLQCWFKLQSIECQTTQTENKQPSVDARLNPPSVKQSNTSTYSLSKTKYGQQLPVSIQSESIQLTCDGKTRLGFFIYGFGRSLTLCVESARVLLIKRW